jgi:outer membrane protein OmpA-like peptidoglycan-associated protein
MEIRPRTAENIRNRTLTIKTVMAVAAAFLVGNAATVEAQTTSDRGLSIERFRLSTDRDGVLDVEWGWVPRRGSWNINLWGDYANDSIVVRDADTNDRLGSLIHHRIGSAASFAYSLTDRFQIGVSLPLVFWQEGQQTIPGVPGLPSQSLGTIGVGNLRVIPKLGLFRSDDESFSLAVLAHIVVPAFQTDGYFGDKTFGVEPELAASLAVGDFRAAINGGYRWRTSNARLLGETVHDELTGRVGIGYRFGEPGEARKPLEFDLTFATATAANAPFDKAVQNAAGLSAAILYDVSTPLTLFAGGGIGVLPAYGEPDFHIVAGVRVGPHGAPPAILPAPVDDDPDRDGIRGTGDNCPAQAEDKDGFEDTDGCPDPDNDKDGVADADDACPIEAGVAENKGCPDKDRDGDGIVDRLDRCPEEAEDKDGFEDTDGCPDPDNDKDGIADADDACPTEPGVAETKGCPDKDRDGDGIVDRLDTCPDEPGTKEFGGCRTKQLARLTDAGIEISDTVYFKVGRDIIQKKSFVLLETVAQVIRNHPEAGNIRIEGHTDSRGDDNHNQLLSEKRAKAVLEFMVQKGVARERLTARGLGETQPIGDNKTAAGRGKNRRVVFAKESASAKPSAP